MLDRSIKDWSARALVGKMKRGEVSFGHAIQRNLTWDKGKMKDRKSLFIHSMIEDYPTPHFYVAKNENKKYEFLDGKQRSHTIKEYLEDEFALYHTTPDATLENGESFEVAGLRFSELPEELQDRISGYMIHAYYFENITEEEITELFFRINNGKPFTSTELTRIKAASLQQISEVARHDIFGTALGDNGLKRYANEDIVMKCWMVLYTENPSYDADDMRSVMNTNEFTEDQILEMYMLFDKMVSVHGLVSNTKKSEDFTKKMLSKIAKKMLNKSNFPALMLILKQSMIDSISNEDLAQWVVSFFAGIDGEGASVSTEYNDTVKSQTSSRENVQKRHSAVLEHYTSYVASIGNTQ